MAHTTVGGNDMPFKAAIVVEDPISGDRIMWVLGDGGHDKELSALRVAKGDASALKRTVEQFLRGRGYTRHG